MASEKTSPVGFRLPDSMLERIDEYVARLAKVQPGVGVSRTDAVRALLLRALDVVEREQRPPAKPRRGSR